VERGLKDHRLEACATKKGRPGGSPLRELAGERADTQVRPYGKRKTGNWPLTTGYFFSQKGLAFRFRFAIIYWLSIGAGSAVIPGRFFGSLKKL
jgi:hypothetical protein